MSFFPANRIGRSRIRFLPAPVPRVNILPSPSARSSSLPTKKRLSRNSRSCLQLPCHRLPSVISLSIPKKLLPPLFLRTDPREQSRPCDTRAQLDCDRASSSCANLPDGSRMNSRERVHDASGKSILHNGMSAGLRSHMEHSSSHREGRANDSSWPSGSGIRK